MVAGAQAAGRRGRHRRRHHRAAAAPLRRGTGAAVPGERARHLAGAGDWPAASHAYLTAARERLEHFADREAEHLAEAGLALNPPNGPQAELLEIRAQTHDRRGEFGRARTDLRTAVTLAESGPVRSRLLTRLAALASGAEDMVRAANLVDLALTEARDDPTARARGLAVGAIVDMNLERPSRAQERYAEALSLYEQVGDARGLADILDAQAMAEFLDGDIDGGIEAFDRVARLFTDAGNLLRVVTPDRPGGTPSSSPPDTRPGWRTPTKPSNSRGRSVTPKAKPTPNGTGVKPSPPAATSPPPSQPRTKPSPSPRISDTAGGQPPRYGPSVSPTRPTATWRPPRTPSAARCAPASTCRCSQAGPTPDSRLS